MAATDKLTIALPRDLAELVRNQVRTGAYASSSEVIGDALRLWRHRDQSLARRIDPRAAVPRTLPDPDFETGYGDE